MQDQGGLEFSSKLFALLPWISWSHPDTASASPRLPLPTLEIAFPTHQVIGRHGKPLKNCTFSAVFPLKTGWKKAESGSLGAGSDMTTQTPYFPPGGSSPSSLKRAWNAVEHSWRRNTQNLDPPNTPTPRISFPLPSKKRICSREPVLAWRDLSIVGVLTILLFSYPPSSNDSKHSPNYIDAGEPTTCFKKGSQRLQTLSLTSLSYPLPPLTNPKF